MFGLPISTLFVLVGVVLVVNARQYGWLGVSAGFVILAVGFILGFNCFKSADSGARFDN